MGDAPLAGTDTTPPAHHRPANPACAFGWSDDAGAPLPCDCSPPTTLPGVEPAIAQGPVCTRCNDTHRMQLGDREVACTFCPVPCQKCRGGGGLDAYCGAWPCPCACHGKPALAAPPPGEGGAREPEQDEPQDLEVELDGADFEHLARGGLVELDITEHGLAAIRLRLRAHLADPDGHDEPNEASDGTAKSRAPATEDSTGPAGGQAPAREEATTIGDYVPNPHDDAPEHFRCPDCGPHVCADEDGCCKTCGADCAIEACPPECLAPAPERGGTGEG